MALRGERFDGHDHLAAAQAKGAAAAVVAAGTAAIEGLPMLEVTDTLAALGALGAAHLARARAQRPLPVLAISGAVGKTTTKELAAAALRAAFGDTLATFGNLNNVIGAPLTLLTLTDAHRAAVIECGSNAPGEIAHIAALVNPDVALVTNADAVREAIAAGAAELIVAGPEMAAAVAATGARATVAADAAPNRALSARASAPRPSAAARAASAAGASTPPSSE